VVEPFLVRLEGRGQMEDRLPVLDGDHPARREGTPVPDAVDRVDDRRAGIPRAQELRVQGVCVPVAGDGAPGGDEGLRRDLAAEDRRNQGRAGLATEDVQLDLEQIEQGLECLRHAASLPVTCYG
jgi:hypothetical protein